MVGDGITFRDLNKNGKLDEYENPQANLEDRVDDLVSQMTLEEKAGSMFITMLPSTLSGEPIDIPVFTEGPMMTMLGLMMPPASEMMVTKRMNSFNIITTPDARHMARFNNNVQKIAERMRLGIPVTLATDPRHGTDENLGAGLPTPSFSDWPSPLGLAATRDTSLVREFADIARQEYRAVGITLALHPMADLSTEPRWARTNGTFGEDAKVSAAMTKAYVLGFQGDSLDSNGVACMTKHFSGGGPQEGGEDAHFAYGKNQVYPGNNFEYHVVPFVEGAFPAKTAQIMPYYGIPIGQTGEDVAFAFNKEIITGLLRDSLKFEGVICTDWGIVSDQSVKEAAAWGVEHLSAIERVEKVLNAGCDMFGGETVPELIIQLVNEGRLEESRLDESVKRIMKDKFRLGLFDNPYVDEDAAEQIAGNAAFRARGKIAQSKSVVLLKNDDLLPLKKGTKIYLSDVANIQAWEGYSELVTSVAEADVVVRKVNTPFTPRSDSFLEEFFKAGRLYYTDEELNEILSDISGKSSVVVANLQRPAILTEINNEADAMIAEFGISDEVLVRMLFGDQNPSGKLPFELPSSWEAVENQFEDLPYDSKDPLYPFGFGLSYAKDSLSAL